MNKKILKRIATTFGILIIGIFVSCAVPNPLTGTWMDNVGSKLTLLPDYTYSARIINSYGEIHDYKGNYNVIRDVIAFTSDDGYQVVTEWDIQGAKLYFEWPDAKGKPLQMKLFRSSR